MPSILKAKSVAVDINAAANTVSDATLVSAINTGTAAVLIVDQGTGNGIYIGAGERVFIEKASDSGLDATTGAASVWATSVAYKA
jgi:hypothetical protein